ncbi:MAG TPA: ATP-binding cassette domain-containing protein [Anaerovoracaceae bacterium]|nr:ATP-binding cassette domain-containing protein [Anaerovoracaceae bacterium]
MAILIRGLEKSFGTHQVLKNVNLRLEENEIYCLMGPSGMGKTTLLRILLGLETVDAGVVEGIKQGEISAMFQEDRLCKALSPVENVALVCSGKVDRKKIRENLEEILPAECLKQPVAELSGGMKRRVALARAINYPSKLILLDEPFTGLDKGTKREVITYLLKMRGNRILLAATHGEEDVTFLGGKKIMLSEISKKEDKAVP